MNTAPPIWLFDGVCVFCSRSVNYFLAHERNHSTCFVAIQSAEGRTIALNHGINPDDPNTFLFIENGQAFEKSDGVLALVEHMNGLARVILFAAFVPKPVRDWFYDRLAKNRYQLFGKYTNCMAPDAKTRSRFVLPI